MAEFGIGHFCGGYTKWSRCGFLASNFGEAKMKMENGEIGGFEFTADFRKIRVGGLQKN